MKQRDLFFSALAVPVDIIAWVGAYIAAYFLRAEYDPLPVTYIWPFSQFLEFIITLVPLIIITMMLEGLYNYRYPKKGMGLLSSIFIAATAGVMYVVLWVFFSRNFFFSRLLIIYAWLLSVVFLILGRWLIHLLRLALYKTRKGLRQAVIIGPPQAALSLSLPLIKHPTYGFNVVGVMNGKKTDNPDIKYLGDIKNISNVIKNNKIDDIIVADENISDKDLNNLADIARDKNITLQLTPNAIKIGSRKFVTNTVADMPMIEIMETPLEGWGRVAKRVCDVIFSILFIIVFSWLYILVAIAVKITSSGPIFYKDRRIGLHGEFDLYKFRTFKKEYCTGAGYGGYAAENLESKLIKEQNTRSGPIPKIQNDPRVTCIGEFLRRTSLDELPQFFNVIKGNMSVVGPRPHRPKEVAGYEEHHKKLFIVKPGITGMAQVSGRSDLDFEDEAQLDLYYIDNWSIWLDVQIAWRTMFVVFGANGAY